MTGPVFSSLASAFRNGRQPSTLTFSALARVASVVVDVESEDNGVGDVVSRPIVIYSSFSAMALNCGFRASACASG